MIFNFVVADGVRLVVLEIMQGTCISFSHAPVLA